MSKEEGLDQVIGEVISHMEEDVDYACIGKGIWMKRSTIRDKGWEDTLTESMLELEGK